MLLAIALAVFAGIIFLDDLRALASAAIRRLKK